MKLDHRDKVDKTPLDPEFGRPDCRGSGRSPGQTEVSGAVPGGTPPDWSAAGAGSGLGRDPVDRRQRKKGEPGGSRVLGRWRMLADGSIPLGGVFL